MAQKVKRNPGAIPDLMLLIAAAGGAAYLYAQYKAKALPGQS